MASNFGDILSAVGAGGKGSLFALIWIVIALLIVALIIGLFWFFWWKKKKWNLDVEIKLTRSDGKMTYAEWGKGFYNGKRGVVFIKRPKMGAFQKPYVMKIFDIRKYMQGENVMTVLQVGPEDFRPVLNTSWNEMEVEYEDTDKPLKDELGNEILDDEGNVQYETVILKESILNIRTETGLNKAWKAAWDEAARNAYTIQSMLRQYSAPISIGIVVICCFVGFAVLWTKLSSVCA